MYVYFYLFIISIKVYNMYFGYTYIIPIYICDMYTTILII